MQRGGWAAGRGEYRLLHQAAGEPVKDEKMGFSGLEDELAAFVSQVLPAPHVQCILLKCKRWHSICIRVNLPAPCSGFLLSQPSMARACTSTGHAVSSATVQF